MFYKNIDISFLTLTDLDIQYLIEEVMGRDPTSFVEIAHAVLDMGGKIVDVDFIIEDDSLVKALDIIRKLIIFCYH